MSTGELAEAVRTLYSDHHRWLHDWLRRKLGCAHSAADLAHDTYVRILISGRAPELGQSRAYLTQIAKGLVIDLHRRRRIETAYLEALAQCPEQTVPSQEERVLLVETLVRIDAALATLPARVKETFLLSQFDGLTYSAIAVRLGISVGAVRKYMLKAAQACYGALDE